MSAVRSTTTSTRSGGVVPLTAVASVEVVDVPTSVTRIDGQRAATVSATPAGQDLGTVRRIVDDIDTRVRGLVADLLPATAERSR